jgi:hypothetical protein
MRLRGGFLVLALSSAAVTVARSGHELPVYPSYYPHEIELATVPPERAADLLLAGKIQAYLGGAPHFAAPPPQSIEHVESLGSFVLVRVNPASATDAASACAMADAVIRDLAGRSGELVLHPYPVTPFHGDFLHHADRAEAAKARVIGGRAPDSARKLNVRTGGDLARLLGRPEWGATESAWDVEIVEADAAALVAKASVATNGWLGPPWIRAGWFHAYLLLGGAVADAALKERIDAEIERLQTSRYGGTVERINLERALVAALAGSCRTRVAGYTVKREPFSTVFTSGIENIAYDSIAGLNSPLFIRTAKLKDFPWNGWLALGIGASPAAAWNPVAGFSDDFGRLMWSAIGDPASLPIPNDSGWIFNRIAEAQSSARP